MRYSSWKFQKKKNQNEVHTANIENYHELQFEWFFDNSQSGRWIVSDIINMGIGHA